MEIKRLLASTWRVIVPFSFLVVIGSLVVWYFDTAPPLTIATVEVRTYAVPRGGELTIDYQIEQHRACPGSLQRVIVDSQDVVQFVEPQDFSATAASRLRRLTVSVPVPVGAATGIARYQAVLSFECNPLQRLFGKTIEVRTPAIEFEVLPGTRSQSPTRFGDIPELPRRTQVYAAVAALPIPGLRLASPPRDIVVPAVCPVGTRRIRPYTRTVDGVQQYVRGHCRAE